jgi:hypothetical protein
MAGAEAEHIAITVQLVNTHNVAQTLSLEPWGDQYVMPAGATIDLVARGPREGRLVVELADTHVAVYGWVGSVLSVSTEGPLM